MEDSISDVMRKAIEEVSSETNDDVLRDEKGRFASRNREDDQHIEDDHESELENEELKNEEEDEELKNEEDEEGKETISDLEPPPNWPLEEQNLFRSQPKAVQEWMIERDKKIASEYTKKTQSISEQKRLYDSIEEVMSPRLENLRIQGISPGQYLNQLIAISDFATRDPESFIKWYSQERKLDLSTLIKSKAPDDEYSDDDFQSPEVKALKDHIRKLESQVTKINDSFTQQVNYTDQQHRSELQSAIDGFKNEADGSGNLVHPYFDEVRVIMGQLMESRQAQDLETAYDMAVYANPETRAKLQAAQKAEAMRKRQEEQKEKARAAQRAGSSITGSFSAGSNTTESAGSVREELSRALSRAM